MTPQTNPIKNKSTQLFKVVAPVADWLAKTVAAVFFVATAYGFVASWLKTNQSQHDLSVAGGILTVSIALYLYLRKR